MKIKQKNPKSLNMLIVEISKSPKSPFAFLQDYSPLPVAHACTRRYGILFVTVLLLSVMLSYTFSVQVFLHS